MCVTFTDMLHADGFHPQEANTCGICFEVFDAKRKLAMFTKCGDSQHECVMCLQCLLGMAAGVRCLCGRDEVVLKKWQPK